MFEQLILTAVIRTGWEEREARWTDKLAMPKGREPLIRRKHRETIAVRSGSDRVLQMELLSR